MTVNPMACLPALASWRTTNHRSGQIAFDPEDHPWGEGDRRRVTGEAGTI